MKTRKKDIVEVKTIALGGGEWAIEVYDLEGWCIKEFVGLNGTREGEEATDLWALYEEWYESLPD